MDTEYKQMRDSARELVWRLYESGTYWGNNDPSEELKWVREWPIPQDTRILDVLTELFLSPPDAAVEGSMERVVWDQSVGELLSVALCNNDAWVEKIRAKVIDPAVRPLIVGTLFALHRMQSEAKTRLVQDLMELIPQMTEDEIDAVIEDTLRSAWDHPDVTEKSRRVMTLLTSAPGHYRPVACFLEGKLPNHSEWEVRASENWRSQLTAREL